MFITKLEEVTKKKIRVYIDEKFAFVLYKGDLFTYHLKENFEISEETYVQIVSELLLKRCKLEALKLLNDMPRTEKQLYGKLAAKEYPPEVIDQAVEYVKSFGYVQDLAFAKNFIDVQKKKYSKLELVLKLKEKGVPSDLIDQAMEESYPEDAGLETVKTLAEKRHYLEKKEDAKEKQKIINYLMRKGFSYDLVMRALSELEED